MPIENRFRHQRYERGANSRAAASFLSRPEPTPTDSAEFSQRMATVGKIFRAAKIDGIYLLHGTFVGRDATGFTRELARLSPPLAEALQSQQKEFADRLARDAGNYTKQFARELEDSLRGGAGGGFRVHRCAWSGENHHVGRADGAIRLLDALTREARRGRYRWIVWGHSHGGNVLALVTNLLGNDPGMNARFLDAAGGAKDWRWPQGTDRDLWRRAAECLLTPDSPLRSLRLDMVTFGTPVRYGWDTAGCERLLHFIHHAGETPNADFPIALEDFRLGRAGDVVQQLAIAGTNFPPSIWAWRARAVNRQLAMLLQSGIQTRDLVTRLRVGRRCHDDGLNLLVNYAAGDPGAKSVGGHAVYTRPCWLLFHAEEIARRLYGAESSRDNER